MNTPLPIRAKLTTAALSLVLVCAFIDLHDIDTRSPGDVTLRIVSIIFSVFLAFFGVFGSARLQSLWGWGLAVAVPLLAALCIFEFRGSDLVLGLLAMVAAVVGSYLLLMDSSVRDYRESLRRRHVAS